MFFDYFILKLIWWALLAVLFSSVMILEGFDYGTLMLMPAICKSDSEKRIMINSIGPVWEGNQVWFIAFGVIIFSAWPSLYVASMTVFFLPVFILLCSLIARPLGFKLRNKIDSPKWKAVWDTVLFFSGLVPSLIIGVAVGNIILGIDFQIREDFLPVFNGKFVDFFSPLSLLCGFLTVIFSLVQGATYSCCKINDIGLAIKLKKIGIISSFLSIACLLFFAFLFFYSIDGFVLVEPIELNAQGNILDKNVSILRGAWSANYLNHKSLLAFPLLSIIFFTLTAIGIEINRFFLAFIFNSIGILFFVFSSFISLFPFIFPSISVPSNSLTVWDSAGGHNSLEFLLLATVILLPIVITYTLFAYRLFSYKLSTSDITNNNSDGGYL